MKQKSVILKNGIELIAVKNPKQKKILLDFTFDAGSKHEKPEENGYTHLLEHLMNQSSSKYKTEKILKTIEIDGAGYYNAGTNRLYTKFYAEFNHKIQDKVLDMFCSMFEDFTITDKLVEKEKKIVLEEVKTKYLNSSMLCLENSHAAALYGNNTHLYTHDIIGEVETIEKANAKKLEALFKRNYSNKNLRVYIYGNINIDSIVKRLEKFKFNEKTFKIKTDKQIGYKYSNTVKFNIISGKTIDDTFNIIMSFPLKHRETSGNVYKHAMTELLGNVLSVNQKYSLFNNIREKKSLCYSIDCSFGVPFVKKSDVLLSIRFQTSTIENIKEIHKIIWEIIDSLKINDISKALADAKACLLTEIENNSYDFNLESAMRKMYSQTLNTNLAIKRRLSYYKHRVRAINSITPEQFQKFIKDIFAKNPVISVLMGTEVSENFQQQFEDLKALGKEIKDYYKNPKPPKLVLLKTKSKTKKVSKKK